MEHELCTCDQKDPHDPPCGSDQCGGQEAVDEWYDEAEADEEGAGGDPLTVRSTHGHLASWH